MGETASSWKRHAAVAVVSFAALFARAAWQVPPGWSGEWDLETTMLVTSSVAHRARHGALAPMGYPFQLDQKAPVWRSDEVYVEYRRQVGVVPAVLAVLAPGDDAAMERFLLGCRYAFAALTSLAAALLIAALSARVGVRAAAGALVAVAASRAFADFSRSLYWTPFLALGAVAWFWWGFEREKLSRWAFWGVYAALVAVKCLNGYEHVSALVLAPVAVVVLAHPELRRAIRESVVAVLVGVGAFAAAFLAHLGYLWRTAGGAAAVQGTFGAAWQRSVGEPVTLKAQVFGAYSAFAHDKVLAAVVVVWVVVMAVRWRKVRALAFSSAAALLGAASWLVVARGHTALAPQFNMLPFYFGAAMLLGAACAEAVLSLREK